MKTLDNVKQDMSTLYEELRAGAIEREIAAELSNIAGKFLKAEQLQLARDILQGALSKRYGSGKKTKTIEHTS